MFNFYAKLQLLRGERVEGCDRVLHEEGDVRLGADGEGAGAGVGEDEGARGRVGGHGDEAAAAVRAAEGRGRRRGRRQRVFLVRDSFLCRFLRTKPTRIPYTYVLK